MTAQPTTSTLSIPFRLLSACILSLSAIARAQNTPAAPQTIEDALHQLSDSAAIIFTGEVTAIRTLTGQNGSSGIVEIDFHVDQAVHGTTTGSIYTLREWAGLWAAGDQRYRTGQHLLMLLHAPGPSGITSPVGGMIGAIPIRATSSALQTATSSITSPPVADLRWVGTRLQRSAPPDSAPMATASSAPTQPQAADASVAAQQAPVSTVLEMLTNWQQASQR